MTANDCPVNCPYLILTTYACGCELGVVIGGIITKINGGEAG